MDILKKLNDLRPERNMSVYLIENSIAMSRYDRFTEKRRSNVF